MENFFRRLEAYIEVPPTSGMADIVVKIMIEVLVILAITTKEINQNSASELTIKRWPIPLDLPFSRNNSEEAGRKDRYRRFVAKTREADSRGGSHGYCGRSKGHARH
jgi:hypothetical protein